MKQELRPTYWDQAHMTTRKNKSGKHYSWNRGGENLGTNIVVELNVNPL
jgi:hypothetical protein